MELKSRRGNAIIEFALGSSVFLALFTATYQFGYTYYVYNNLLSAVRAGARYGSITPYDSLGPTVDCSPTSQFVAGVKNVVVYGSPTTSVDAPRAPIVSGLTPDNVNVNVSFANGMPSIVTVSIVRYNIDSLFGIWTVSNKPIASFLYTGRYAPPPA